MYTRDKAYLNVQDIDDKKSICSNSQIDRYTIRQLTLFDLLAVHKLYNFLSDGSKQYYRSLIYGLPKKPIWFFAQIALIISLSPLREIILHVYPKYLYFIVGVFDQDDKLCGFAHFVLHGYSSDRKLIGRLGIAVNDKFQGKGLGYKLMEKLLVLARDESVDRIYLDVLSVNNKGLGLYKKCGFEIIDIQRNAGNFMGKKADIYNMILDM